MTVRQQLEFGSGHHYRGGGSTVPSGPVPGSGVNSVGIVH